MGRNNSAVANHCVKKSECYTFAVALTFVSTYVLVNIMLLLKGKTGRRKPNTDKCLKIQHIKKPKSAKITTMSSFNLSVTLVKYANHGYSICYKAPIRKQLLSVLDVPAQIKKRGA